MVLVKAVILQAGLILFAAFLVMPWLGGGGFVSVVLGGGAYLLPNLVFVVRLRRAASRETASAATFFVGEFAKLLATIALLGLAQRYVEVNWLALILGLFVALKANLFAFLLKS